MVKKLLRYVKPFSSDTGTFRTDRQTNGQTDIFAISISRVSVLTRDKNPMVPTINTHTAVSYFGKTHGCSISGLWPCSVA